MGKTEGGDGLEAWKFTVTGRVQGVGFRPFVCRAAEKFHLSGTVKNLGGLVEIFAEGERADLVSFSEILRAAPLPISVEFMETEETALRGFSDFRAIESDGAPREPVFPADIGICEHCRRELHDARDRHFRYPFLSCTACGPRYTIVRNLPYDRERTTMDAFSFCDDCAAEYTDLGDRRCHGETIACPACGPVFFGKTRTGHFQKEEALSVAIRLLRDGEIISVKAMGGYQLLCRADVPEAVARLRILKRRPRKPFAMMLPDAAAVSEWVFLSETEKEILTLPARPILLARPKRKVPAGIAERVPLLGVMLPSTGLYVLLAEAVSPLVVTSANVSGEPILYKDAEAETFFETNEAVAGIFSNNREILRPADDSVVKVTEGALQIVRRTRGFLPEPVLRLSESPALLATGADMEPGFCLASGGRFYPAQIPCEWENEAAARAVAETETDCEEMLGIAPAAICADLHPAYESSAWGQRLAQKRNLPLISVQHHHAHALSVMAEHALSGPCLAFIFDGTGYGADGTIWGGEILLCEGGNMRRAGHLRAIPMPGGDAAAHHAWASAFSYLHAAGLSSEDPRYAVIAAAIENQIGTIENSSMGRLFDAACFLLGFGEENTYKSECPMALEAAAVGCDVVSENPLWEGEETEDGFLWDGARLLKNLSETEWTPAQKAAAFHAEIVRMVTESAAHFGVRDIVLSGGCFLNGILFLQCKKTLEGAGFRVYANEKVPCGDGGIALGQAYFATVRPKDRKTERLKDYKTIRL